MKDPFSFLSVALGILLSPALVPAQNLFVANDSSGDIYEFTSGGVRSTFASGSAYPQTLAFNSAGDLFEANYD